MKLHIQPTRLAVRLLPDGAEYGAPFIGNAQAMPIGFGLWLMSEALVADGDFQAMQWKELCWQLKQGYGADYLLTARMAKGGGFMLFDTSNGRPVGKSFQVQGLVGWVARNSASRGRAHEQV